MNLAPNEPDPQRQIFEESLGRSAGRGRLLGRKILIVGAGQRDTEDHEPPVGNGRAISLLFAREGAKVACVDKSEAAVRRTCELVASEGGDATPYMVDVRNPTEIDECIDRCIEDLGGFDGLVLNVGISHGLPLEALTVDAWDLEYDVNVRSHMLFSRRAIQVMPSGSSIVLTSSLASLRSTGRNPAYESSKAAQVSLARSIAAAGEPKGIRCNSVLPGLMDTPMGRDASRRRPNRAAAVPFGRQGTGWEVAYAALFLVSNESSYVNAHALVVDGGLGFGIQRT